MDSSNGVRSMAEAKKDIGLYLMDYYNWQRPHTRNDGLAPAAAEEKLSLLSRIC
jgi:putative transposase